MLNFRFARDEVTENLHITERALLPTFLNRLAPMGLKIKQERLEESLVKQVTCVMPVAVRERLQILRETVPGLRRLAIMGNVDNPASVLDMAKVHAAARTHGLDAPSSKFGVPKILCPHLRRSRAAWTRFISHPMRS